MTDGSLGRERHGYDNENKFQLAPRKTVSVAFLNGGKANPKSMVSFENVRQGFIYLLGDLRIFIVENELPTDFNSGKIGPQTIQFRVIDKNGLLGPIVVANERQIEGMGVLQIYDAELRIVEL